MTMMLSTEAGLQAGYAEGKMGIHKKGPRVRALFIVMNYFTGAE